MSYWKDAKFYRGKDTFTSKIIEPSLMVLDRVPFPENIPNFRACPYGTCMDINLKGTVHRLPSQYDGVDPRQFVEFQKIFHSVKFEMVSNGIFGAFKQPVAEALRRNEKCFYSVFDLVEEKKRKNLKMEADVEYVSVVVPQLRKPGQESEVIEYHIVMEGPVIKVHGDGYNAVSVRVFKPDLEIDCGEVKYSDALYHIFSERPEVLHWVVTDLKEKSQKIKYSMESFIQERHVRIRQRLVNNRGSDLERMTEWAFRTLASHPKFLELNPDLNLEELVLIAA